MSVARHYRIWFDGGEHGNRRWFVCADHKDGVRRRQPFLYGETLEIAIRRLEQRFKKYGHKLPDYIGYSHKPDPRAKRFSKFIRAH